MKGIFKMVKVKSATEKTANKPTPKPKKVVREKREVIYPNIKFSEFPCTISPSLAKELLGWEEAEEKEYDLIDKNKTKIKLKNNHHNRPLYLSQVETYTQEILNKRWAFNGEPIIIGQTGTVLNGQHTLVSLVFADQLLAKDEVEPHQSKLWKGEDTFIDKLTVYGVPETDQIINTMDTCKPRTLADVIYRSEYFQHLKTGERKLASKITDYAIRYLWYRTGVGIDAYAIRRTHAESIDFLEHHKSLLKAVWFIMTEDGVKKNLSKLLPLGYMSALLYLMAASDTDQATYQNKRVEGVINFDKWDKAQQFFMLLNKGSFPKIIQAHASLMSLEGEGGGTIKEKVAVIITGWQNFLDKKDETHIKLIYEEDEEGRKHLAEFPIIGGIDMGEVDQIRKNDSEGENEDEDEESETPETTGKGTPNPKKEREKKIKKLMEERKKKGKKKEKAEEEVEMEPEFEDEEFEDEVEIEPEEDELED